MSTTTDTAVVRPDTGELLVELASAPPEVLADFYAAIRDEERRLKAMREMLRAELEQRLATRGVAVLTVGDYEIGVKRGKRSSWDGQTLEDVVRGLIDAGAVTYRDVAGLISHDVKVNGNVANSLSRRLVGEHKAAVEACRSLEPTTHGFDVVRSLPLVPEQ
jgi:hypothetical protein